MSPRAIRGADMKRTRLILAAGLALTGSVVLFFGGTALADEGLATFGHIAEPAGGRAADPWGPVPTQLLSLVNVAPGLLPYFNNALTFGVPGTVVGGFWENTQVTSDWGGARTELARRGFFFDVYSTSTYQNVTAGGLKTGGSFVQNNQISINIDTGRAGWWAGGLIHFTAQARSGDSPENTFTVGSYVPQYTGLVEPGPLFANNIYPSEYFLVQALSKQFSVVLGKISDVFIPDQTLFSDSYKYYFANFNLNKNPMTTNFYNPTAWAGLGVWTPTNWLAVVGGVLDPNTKADNFAADAYDRVNLFLTAIASYKIGGLPGQFSPSYNWSNKPKIDLGLPFGPLSPALIPQAVGVLVGSPFIAGLPINYRADSWFVIANVSQYLFVVDDPTTIAKKLKSGDVINGIGIFGRVGYAPQDLNTVTRDASVALTAHGLFYARRYDSFGVGFYYNEISGDLKNDITQLTAGMSTAKNEKGIEVFYDFAITPAIRLIPSYQHVWSPLTAQVALNQSKADIFLARLNVAW